MRVGVDLIWLLWPTVELKRSAETAAIASSPLTLDAQQRSLEHRISNLSKRLKVMKGNLRVLMEGLPGLGTVSVSPMWKLKSKPAFR